MNLERMVPLGIGSVTAEIAMNGDVKDVYAQTRAAIGNEEAQDSLESIIEEFAHSNDPNSTLQMMLRDSNLIDNDEDVELVGAQEQAMLMREAAHACYRLLS